MKSLTDTTSEVAKLQRLRLKGMSPADRLVQVESLSKMVIEMAEAGIRRDHPDASESEIRSLLLVRKYGAEYVETLPLQFRLTGETSDRQWRDVLALLRSAHLDDDDIDVAAMATGLDPLLTQARREIADQS